MTLKRFSRLRELMVPRDDAVILAQADMARDERRWADAVDLYRRFVALHPDRDGLLMQAGHCLKEIGDCQGALVEYLAVQDGSEKPEADFQAGELLKLTGNFAAARRLYTRSAAAGHEDAGRELERLVRGEVSLQHRFHAHAVETGRKEDELLARLCAAELSPLDWRRLAAAAEAAAISGADNASAVLANLALIVGGPVADRLPAYRTVFGASGLWNGAYASDLDSDVFSRHAPRERFGKLADMLDFSAIPIGYGVPATAPTEIRSIKDVAGLTQSVAAVMLATAAIRAAVFAKGGVRTGPLVEAISALQDTISPAALHHLPEDGRYNLASVAQCVSLNAAAVVSSRLAGSLEMLPPHVVAATFAIPTLRATLSTCAAGDGVPAVLDFERETEDPALLRKLDELIALGIIPGDRAEERLLALADQACVAPLEYWFRTSAPTGVPALVGEVAIRLGNSLKKRGRLHEALHWTRIAAAVMPDRYTTDLGILCKANGDFAGAVSCFSEALAREPENESIARELNAVVREVLDRKEIEALAAGHPKFGEIYRNAEKGAQERREEAAPQITSTISGTVFDISELRETLDFGHERLEWRQIGWLRTGSDGRQFPRLVGVVAIRLCHVTRDPPLRLRIRIDGRTVDTVEPSLAGTDGSGAGKYYFNSWIDTAGVPRGAALLQAYVEQASSGYASLEETVVIDDLRPDEDYERSDAYVPGPPKSQGGLVERVLGHAAMARDATRSAFDRPVERVLVMRLDQLGDLSASMPAIRRLRELFPAARFEGLVTPVNAYILRASGLFDEVTTVDFPYDHGTRKRWLARRDHAMLAGRYAAAPVDIAIDLSPGEDSRPILKLINARYRAGFKPHRFDFLDFGIDVVTRDPVNRKEAVSHTAMIAALIDALAAMFRPPPPRFPADEKLLRHLKPLKLAPRAYIAIHAGARLAIKRWPLDHYIHLAGLLRAETKRDIVMFSDEPLSATQLTTIEAIGGVAVMSGRTDFEVFDAIVSNAALFVGNDTGPKHLASMRGTRTVSVHMGQVNWNEWGQDGEGLIVSKRVPCTGCGIEDPAECGKGMACLDGLKPREVADAVAGVL